MIDVKEATAWETIKLLPNRAASLIYNMISRWGLMLGLTLYLVVTGRLTDTNALIGWLVFSVLFLFKSDGIEFLKDIIGKVK